jgi:hypothetical protein
MSNYEGQPLHDMNPFSNNRPRLTASERIRNKRDAVIYEAEKKQFQESKKKCGNRNVRFYKNGKIKSMKSYKLQKSLARGNILCNDCDNKGTFCEAPASKDDLNTIYMGNNSYSEFWGGAKASWDDDTIVIGGATTIISDISGVWGGSPTDISKSLIGPGGILPGSLPNISIPFGYVRNLIKIPRNLDGSGIVIDPSNILFPDELCDPFRYLQSSYLKTYAVITSGLAIYEKDVINPSGVTLPFNRPLDCFDASLNSLTGITTIGESGLSESAFFGVVSSVCCIGNIDEMLTTFVWYTASPPEFEGNFGLFKIYVELLHLDINAYQAAMMKRNILPFRPATDDNNWFNEDMVIRIVTTGSPTPGNFIILPWMIQSLNIIQGSIPPSQNQSKYNATEQSYMACLENGTQGINFTKQNTRIPVKNVVCSRDMSGNTV